MKTIILPQEVAQRWQQCLTRERYTEWLAYSNYLLALSRLAVNDFQFASANDLLMLSQVAHQRAVDMEPQEVAA